jgi:hypothetical protein
MRCQKSDPLDPFDSVDSFQKVLEGKSCFGISVGVHILTEELNFEISFLGQLSDFLDDIPFGSVLFSAPCERDDTIGTKIVTSLHDGCISTGFSLSVDHV